ncbi:hypothetical protein HDU98_001584 [Podochytrium sp. JEL0797]|nr:hypothetical protein HDU98_001584 [Podochytrium sp. JEL0797]
MSFDPSIRHANAVPSTSGAGVDRPRRKARSKPVSAISIMSKVGSLVKGISSLSSSPSNPVVVPKTMRDSNGPESILCCKFVNLPRWDAFAPSAGKNIGSAVDDGCLCLLIGYETGFQVWSVSGSHGVELTQIVSVRKGVGRVLDIDVVAYPVGSIQREFMGEEAVGAAPMLVFVESPPVRLGSVGSAEQEDTNTVQLYSLKTHEIVKSWKFEEKVVGVKSSDRLIVISLSNFTLQVYSALSLNFICIVPDAYPVFTPGSRLLIYAATTAPPPPHSSPDESASTASVTVQVIAMEGLKKATTKVVKEVLGGAGYLGSVGYSAVSNYFHPREVESPRLEAQVVHTGVVPLIERKGIDGVVSVLEVPIEVHLRPQRGDGEGEKREREGDAVSLVAKWKPHTSKISNLTMNVAQTRLFTSSTSANTFYIFDVRVGGTVGVLPLLYKLERGFTPASVESVTFSDNGRWCCVSTARGTTHVYPVPEGTVAGVKETELAVLNGWVDVQRGRVEAVREAVRVLAGDTGVVYPCARVKQGIAVEDEEGARRGVLGVGVLFEVVGKPVKSVGKGGVGSSGSPGSFGGVGVGGEEFVRLFRQRVVSVHPAGFVTLHYLDLGVYGEVGSPGSGGGGLVVGSLGASPRSFGSVSGGGRFGVGSAASGGGVMGCVAGQPKVVVKDVGQWDVRRCGDWGEAKTVLEMAREPDAPLKSGQWASQIETTTFDAVLFGAPIWMDLTFKMSLYAQGSSDDDGEEEVPEPISQDGSRADLSDLPTFKKMEVRHQFVASNGKDPRFYPSMADSHIAPALTSAMVDTLDAMGATPVWQRDDVSFEDAFVVEEVEGEEVSPGLGLSVQLGYFGKMKKKYEGAG